MGKLFKFGTNCYRFLFARRFFYKWNRWVLHCGLKGLGINNCGDKISGEKAFLDSLCAQVKTPVLFDVGANVGNWSLMALDSNPKCAIFAFEPNPAPFKKLSQVRNIQAFNLACGELEETRTLYDRKDKIYSTHASLEESVVTQINKGVRKTKVHVVTLDYIITKHKIKRIDLLKIDVEGFEFEVLKGAQTAIREGIIRNIQFEFNAMNVWRRRFLKDFQDLLPHFTFYRLLPNGMIPLRCYDPMFHEIFVYQNLLAMVQDEKPPTLH